MRTTNTYDGQGCDGAIAPWVYGLGPIQWEDVTANAWKKYLGAGWHEVKNRPSTGGATRPVRFSRCCMAVRIEARSLSLAYLGNGR